MIPVLVAVLTLGGWQAPPADTLQLGVEEAFLLALEAAPSLEASRRRTLAADAFVRQAGAWPNPVLSVTAENLGATRPISGVPGLDGVEGQALISGLLPVGGDRGAARSGAEARLSEARSLEAAVDGDVRLSVVEILARANRDGQRLRRAHEEAAGLQELADALAAQAELGRAPVGEAARAHLAAVSAHTTAAQVAAEAAASREELAFLLGLEPGTSVRVVLPTCPAPASDNRGDVSPPEVRAALARRQAAAADVSLQRAARIPDVAPQLGVRRAAGVSALYLGVSIPLPLFDRRGAAVEAARQEESAAQAEVGLVERSFGARREAARQGLAALEGAGARYTTDWAGALAQAVLAAEARYRLGEGTLTELLDGRRARLQALDGYERWRAELFVQRARLARLSGDAIDASLLCGATVTLDTLTREGRS